MSASRSLRVKLAGEGYIQKKWDVKKKKKELKVLTLSATTKVDAKLAELSEKRGEKDNKNSVKKNRCSRGGENRIGEVLVGILKADQRAERRSQPQRLEK